MGFGGDIRRRRIGHLAFTERSRFLIRPVTGFSFSIDAHICEMTNDNTNTLMDVTAIAAEALAALDGGHQIAPFSARLSAFGLEDAYRVTAAVRKMRETRGELPVGCLSGISYQRGSRNPRPHEPLAFWRRYSA